MPQKEIFNNLLDKLDNQLSVLTDKSEENAYNTLCALWHKAANNKLSPIKAIKVELLYLKELEIALLEESISRRLSGVPLAHITERQHFMGLDYIVNEGLYIPRKETELLAQTSIDLIKKNNTSNQSVNVIDLCCGIGTVALAISYYCKNTVVYGSDIYNPAIEAAKINANHFGLSNSTTFYCADLFTPFENLEFTNKIDLIVSAPPYITSIKVKQMDKEIAEYEPIEAFDAGPFGISIFNKLISTAPEYLCGNGYLIFECGLGQGKFLSTRLRSNKNYDEVTEICDEHGNIRVLKARRVIGGEYY